jgi:hypothetical protein
MRHTHLHEVAGQRLPLQGDREVQAEIPDIGQGHPYLVVQDFGLNKPRQGLEGEAGVGNALHHRKAGGAAGAVATHLSLGAVGIKEPPAKVGSVRVLNEDEAVGSHTYLGSAHPLGKPVLLRFRDMSFPVVHQDKIIAPTVHLEERKTTVGRILTHVVELRKKSGIVSPRMSWA